mmetsp:Transcript_46457/g.68669  ORF Transcript_46457/g.68669 Transcript_46457/m.68669 type:complete len:165 (-) Transcript_46457:381-875(-)|eukprot:CAMPEP_0195517518 /NCGR_PEP_ID=MMETSP0794_2-20130614/10990_1 /TAXON_ID=515487 /ORGANISM="Stephanopyxis turris, Strain CCMP 815" /LENGTH=164 /DNA_ID=CAMNT_0040646337 /DNA_START=15 /DNA_END=509 /DNA_ORIENTATION=+
MNTSKQQDPTSKSRSKGDLMNYVGPSTCLSAGVLGFLRGSIYGSIWGGLSPFMIHHHAAASGSKKLLMIAPSVIRTSSRLIPIYLSSMTSNGLMFGGIFGAYSLSSSTMAYVRKENDIFNDVFGFGVTYGYIHNIWKTEFRELVHNRVMGALVVGSIVYANFGV